MIYQYISTLKILLKNQHYTKSISIRNELGIKESTTRTLYFDWKKNILLSIFGRLVCIIVDNWKEKNIFMLIRKRMYKNKCLHIFEATLIYLKNAMLFIFIDFKIILLIKWAPLNSAFNKKQNSFSPSILTLYYTSFILHISSHIFF